MGLALAPLEYTIQLFRLPILYGYIFTSRNPPVTKGEGFPDRGLNLLLGTIGIPAGLSVGSVPTPN